VQVGSGSQREWTHEIPELKASRSPQGSQGVGCDEEYDEVEDEAPPDGPESVAVDALDAGRGREDVDDFSGCTGS